MGGDVELAVWCRVLGTPEVEVAGRAVRLGSPQAVTVWSQLLAARGRRVSDDRLVDLLWPEDPPRTAIGTLRVHVTRLRNVVDPGRAGILVREHAGYRVSPALLDTDAARFERDAEVALGTPLLTERLRLVRAALSSWSGEPYDGVEDVGHVASERDRLEDLRHHLDRARLETLVDLGDVDGVLPELRRSVEERPTDEGAHELLALALYRGGRQADALESLRSARAVLLDGWGLDPGPGLARLEAAVLRQDPDLDVVRPPVGAGDAAAVPVADPPDPASPDPRPVPVGAGGVPRPTTSFVGRESERARVEEALERGRCVSLVAIGGTGKTRLAVEVASAWTWGEAPVFVDLAGLAEAGLVVERVATAAGLLPGGGLAGLVAALAERDLLLVLDNCEDRAAEVAELVGTLLDGCRGIRVLATSRVPLGVASEHVLDLGPLPPAAAAELFRRRAVAAGGRPGELADDDAVHRVCAAFDGHPLAVELAAGQSRVLSLAQIEEELEDRFALLAQRRVGAERRDRGESLAAIVAWSVDRLTDVDRDRFGRLALFEGGFDLEAARAVCAGRGLVGSLLGLVDAGLLDVVETATGRRYRMLETLRAYALETTPEADREDARTSHRRWVVDLARAAAAELRGPEGRAWTDRLEVELPNARAALASAVAAGDGLAARSVAGDLGWFWFRRAHVAEGLRWTAAALELPPGADEVVDATEADDPAGDARGRARTSLAAGLVSYLAGRFEELGAHGARAAEWGERCGDVATVVTSWAYQSYLLAYAGQVGPAGELSARAEARARAEAPAWAVAEVLMLRGQLLRSLGDPGAALDTFAEGAELAGEHGHTWCQGSALWGAGKVALDLGDLPRAAELAAASARLQHAAGDVSSWLVSLHLLAGVAALDGRGREGGLLLGAVGEQGRRIGFDPEVMDPVDSPRNVAAVREALDADRFEEGRAAGADLDADAVMAIVDALVPPTVAETVGG